MTKALNATEAAVYTALSGAGLVGAVYQHVPEKTPPPVNIIGDLSGEPLGVKGGDPDEHISLAIMTVMQKRARKPVLDEQERIITALDNVTLTSVSGWIVSLVRESDEAFLMPDGETYLGTVRFTGFALQT